MVSMLDRAKAQSWRQTSLLDLIDHGTAARVVDGLSVVLGTNAAGLLIKSLLGLGAGRSEELAILSISIAVMFVVMNELRGLYRSESLAGLASQCFGVTSSWLGVWAMLAILGFAMKASADFSRASIGGILLVDLAVLLIARAALHRHYVGDLASSRKERVALLRIGAVDLDSTLLNRCAVVHSAEFRIDHAVDFSEFVEAARARDASKVILSIPPDRLADAPTFVERLRELPVPIFVVTEGWLSSVLARPRTLAGEIPAFEVRSAPLSIPERMLKRGFDLLFTGTALLLLAPFMVLVAIAVKLDSPGPALFKQRRLGFNGREFRILKFRSMTVAEDGPSVVQATRDDKRVTAIGRVIRATSIDELPQLFNVLRGDMSLVGPRPHAVAHDNAYEALIADYSLRRHMKPGLTGWAQVNGFRGETNSVDLMQRRVEHDLWYIDNWNVWLDIKILALTVVALLRNRDVY